MGARRRYDPDQPQNATQRRVLAALAARPKAIWEIADETSLHVSTVSSAIEELRSRRLVVLTHETRARIKGRRGAPVWARTQKVPT